jgi:hypothetical protein
MAVIFIACHLQGFENYFLGHLVHYYAIWNAIKTLRFLPAFTRAVLLITQIFLSHTLNPSFPGKSNFTFLSICTADAGT